MIDQYPPANGVLTSLIWRKTMSGGETSLSGYDNASQALSYTPGQEQVYLNGILLVRGDDYTATNGTSITGLSALSASDFVQVNCYNNFSVASLPSTSITGEITNSQITSLATSKLTGTIANNQLANSSITINGSAVSLGGSTTIAGGSAQDDAPTSPTEGQLWLDTNGTLATTAFVEKADIGAKGDLFVGSANDTVSILNVGESGSTLVADSAASTGLRYTAGVGLVNPVINGAFDIWQRGTTLSPAGGAFNPIADRWGSGRAAAAGGYTITRQTTSDTTNLPNIQYCIRVARNNGDTITGGIQTAQNLETVNSIPYAGKTVTISAYVRKGSSYSGSTVSLSLNSGTGTDQNINNGYTGNANVCTTSFTPTTSWVRYSATGTVSASATELAIYFYQNASGTASDTNDYIEVTGVQIDAGNVALPFRRSGGTIAGELYACQRYYSTSTTNGTHSLSTTQVISAPQTDLLMGFRLPVAMRVAPTVTIFSRNNNSGKVSKTTDGTDIAGTVTAANIGNHQVWGLSTGNLTAGTAGYEMSYTANAEL